MAFRPILIPAVGSLRQRFCFERSLWFRWFLFSFNSTIMFVLRVWSLVIARVVEYLIEYVVFNEDFRYWSLLTHHEFDFIIIHS